MKTLNSYIYIYFIIISNCFIISKSEKFIISLTTNHENIYNTFLIINSINSQNVNKDSYDILVIFSSYDYANIEELPIYFLNLKELGNINFIFVKQRISDLTRTLITMKRYKNNPLILINNKCLLPNGWLEMLINDHFKYPNDAIASNIEFYFGKDGEIKEFSEGFIGEKFGKFNHITEMVFNFAILNIDLGGILYPKNYFKNILFYNEDLFMKIIYDSEDFWHSAFIMFEDKILRQSSKIFDYTKYLLNDINYDEKFNIYKIKLLKQKKLSFIKEFPNFNKTIQKRQNKIIVSITSYPKRFVFLPGLMTFIRNQDFQIDDVYFFFYKEDIKYFDFHIKDVKIILTDKNLRPHLKYFYAMQSFRDYAIITLDDDMGYANDTFKSLFNAYLENPNVISGRRSHLMTYNENGELKRYYKWKHEQKLINKTNFDLTLTNVGGSIFPPDILNVNDDFLPIINETITCDDLTLKYFANMKGIPQKWIFNNKVLGIPRKLPRAHDSPLFKINTINNDICINKLNIMINTTILKNLCVPYRNIPTGNSIYLFNIHNKKLINNILYFELFAYSFCPIDTKIKFNIYFENYYASCGFNQSEKLIFNYTNNLHKKSIAICYMNVTDENLDFYFPVALSKDKIFINICNYRKYLINIFIDFACQKRNNCILKTILLDKIYYNIFSIIINDKQYSCEVDLKKILLMNDFPVLQKFKCIELNYLENNTKTFISGIPKNLKIKHQIFEYSRIYKQFIVSRITNKITDLKRKTIIIGNLVDDLEQESYNFTINALYPNTTLKCNLKPNSKYVQSKIYCINDFEFNSEIFIENQIVHLLTNKEELLLINEETYIKIKFNQTYNEFLVINKNNKEQINNKNKQFFIIFIFIIFILSIIIIKIKFFMKSYYLNKLIFH